jgi:hypothetical protein
MRVKTSAIALAVTWSFLAVASGFALSSPEYTLQKCLKQSIGANPQNDNLGDYHGNENEVAAKVFAYVCNDSFFDNQIMALWTTKDLDPGSRGEAEGSSR